MENLDFKEKIWGGIFGVIAIIAAVAELLINGVNAGSVAAAIKDVFGTLVVILVFVAVIKERFPKGKKLHEKLQLAIEQWQEDNANMIIRKPGNDKEIEGIHTYSLDMKTDVKEFYTHNGASSKTGLFVRMPQFTEENYRTGAVKLYFSLNKGTFFGDIPAEQVSDGDFKAYAKRFEGLVNDKHNGFAKADAIKPKELVITINHPDNQIISMDDYVKQFMDVLNTVYTAYLVSARIKQ